MSMYQGHQLNEPEPISVSRPVNRVCKHEGLVLNPESHCVLYVMYRLFRILQETYQP